MSENVIQTSFSAGELAPTIFARTDIAAYHQGAARMRNFFVDYRSGASTRTGTKFIIQAFNSAKAVRLIPFIYSTVTTYVIEFGDGYCRFLNNGASVLETGFAISGITAANPAVVTAVGNNFVNGDWVFISGVVGMPQINGRYYSVTVVGAAVTLSDVNGNAINASSYGTYVSGGTISRVYKITSPYAAADLALLKFTQSASVMTITHPAYPITTLTFNAPTNWVFANPALTNSPFAVGEHPGVVCYFQQRIWYAASLPEPETFWASETANFNNFTVNSPVQASDAITGTLVSLQVNAIKWMIPMSGGLILGTATGAWTINSGSGTNSTAAVTPINITATPQAYNGANDVPPIAYNNDILYVQFKGSIVRDLKFNIYASTYTGSDISVRSNHLFFGHQILQWAFAEEPFKLVWMVREDGVLLTLTFVTEQEIYGWAHHDTNGLFESVAVVTETVNGVTVDAVYVVVKRYINGLWVQFIERFAERFFPYGAEDAWNVDAGIQTTLPTPAANLTASGTSGSVTFTADQPIFSLATVGQVLRMGGGIATITSFVSSLSVVGNLKQPISSTLPAGTPIPAASGTWSLATPETQFFGFDYLAGETLSILADGGVIPPTVVQPDGSIILPQPATKVTGGFGFQAQLQTMPLDTGEPTIQGKRKKIAALNLKVASTRGLKAGRTFNTLVPLKDMNPSVPLGQAIPLITGDTRVVMDPLWNVSGQICLQVDDPLPASILGVIPEVVIGDSVK
jgi:hypothetical protein